MGRSDPWTTLQNSNTYRCDKKILVRRLKPVAKGRGGSQRHAGIQTPRKACSKDPVVSELPAGETSRGKGTGRIDSSVQIDYSKLSEAFGLTDSLNLRIVGRTKKLFFPPGVIVTTNRYEAQVDVPKFRRMHHFVHIYRLRFYPVIQIVSKLFPGPSF